MKTVQMTLEESLLTEVDEAVERLGTTRSAFTRQVLRSSLASIREKELEQRHEEGYRRHPVQPGEFDNWENEQTWID